MSYQPSLFGPEPDEMTMREYHLNCRVVVKGQSYQNHQSRGFMGNMTEEMVFLLPLEGSERDRFLTAWAPQPPDQHYELNCMSQYGPMKCSIHRPDHRIADSFYLFVMSKAAEDDLKAHYERMVHTGHHPSSVVIRVTVLPEMADAVETEYRDAAVAGL